ncbi:MAG: hypothetical protein OEW80_02850 [Gemmatimonadota bacterium]|nr:hypothetical protein [Gemmatimonadota bacterium]MDH5282801.1 hypothetical protein [Gemmatimonadota bacterium]
MRRPIVVLLVAMGAVTASACARGGAAPTVVAALAPVTASTRLYSDDGPAFTDSVRLAVRDMATWQQVWAQATSTQGEPPPLPQVDFSQEMVLVAAAGQMHPGDQIRVDSAGVRTGVFVAVVRTITACRPFPAAAYPLDIVRVRRSDLEVTWAERRERAPDCQ